MAYRFREQYQAVLNKRQHLRESASLSVPDEPGARVAILVPFLAELVYDKADSLANFERQTAELMEYYTGIDRQPYAVMGAVPADFEQVLTDRTIPTVVIEGFGNFSATAVSLYK